jgi:pimeloyl-ACP methyl ester carboxylesterase
VRGGRLAFWHLGRGGVPLLLVHGWPATRRIRARNVADLPRDERRFEDSHGFRPATEPDALLAELATPQARMDYVAGHYRRWSPPGAFGERDLAYLAGPFADAAKLRASFGTYESLTDPAKRTGRSMITANDTPALILMALADPCCYPAFAQRAALTFARHTGPFGIFDAGHSPQWEAAQVMNDAITMFCAGRLGTVGFRRS